MKAIYQRDYDPKMEVVLKSFEIKYSNINRCYYVEVITEDDEKLDVTYSYVNPEGLFICGVAENF